MPNRILREGINESEAVNKLSMEGELFYRRLMSVVDDFGRFEANPIILASRLFALQPKRWTAAKISAALKECSRVMITPDEPLVLCYTVSGKQFLQMNRFRQRTRSQSKYPDPETLVASQENTSPDAARSSVSSPPSDDGHVTVTRGQDLQGRNLPTPSPHTPPHSNGFSGKEVQEENQNQAVAVVVPPGYEKFEEIIGIFLAFGRGLSFTDKIECENRWTGYSLTQQIKAHRCAVESLEEWRTRPTDKIPYPVNWFRYDQWERYVPRLLARTAPKSEKQSNHDRAAARFMASEVKN